VPLPFSEILEALFMPSIDRAPDGSPGSRIGRSVSLDQAAELLGVSRRTIYNRIREGRLQTIRTIGGSQRVLLDSLTEPHATEPRDRGGLPSS
jgi:excisionase family DNA binding protein